MTRDEALKLLRGGAEGISEWNRRRDEGEAIPSLQGAKLAGVTLAGANLSGADLRDAILNGARIIQADFRGAKLDRVQLIQADIARVDFRDASLTEVILVDSALRSADLKGARLSGAQFGHTAIGWVDLSEVEDLESVTFVRPCSIAVDTLIWSKGKIPETFLRGCGVPEDFITYLPSLIGAMEPIQFYSCFISHSSEDGEFCQRLHSRLRDEKLRVWYSSADMRGGRQSDPQIDDAIRVYDRLLLVLSNASMQSDWVRREIKKARQKERDTEQNVLFPIRLVPFDDIRAWECMDSDTGEDLAEKVREYHIPDFSNWRDHDSFESAFAKLMADLRREDTTGNSPTHGM